MTDWSKALDAFAASAGWEVRRGGAGCDEPGVAASVWADGKCVAFGIGRSPSEASRGALRDMRAGFAKSGWPPEAGAFASSSEEEMELKATLMGLAGYNIGEEEGTT